MKILRYRRQPEFPKWEVIESRLDPGPTGSSSPTLSCLLCKPTARLGLVWVQDTQNMPLSCLDMALVHSESQR